MGTLRYYKVNASNHPGWGDESKYGTTYFEFTGDTATRQVEVIGDLWLCSLADYHPGRGLSLFDGVWSDLELTKDQEIRAEEFDTIWAEAVRRYSKT